MWGQLPEAGEHHQRGRLVQLHWRCGLSRGVGGAPLSRALALSAELVTICLEKGDWDELVL